MAVLNVPRSYAEQKKEPPPPVWELVKKLAKLGLQAQAFFGGEVVSQRDSKSARRFERRIRALHKAMQAQWYGQEEISGHEVLAAITGVITDVAGQVPKRERDVWSQIVRTLDALYEETGGTVADPAMVEGGRIAEKLKLTELVW